MMISMRVCARRAECVHECVMSAAHSNTALSLFFLSCLSVRNMMVVVMFMVTYLLCTFVESHLVFVRETSAHREKQNNGNAHTCGVRNTSVTTYYIVQSHHQNNIIIIESQHWFTLPRTCARIDTHSARARAPSREMKWYFFPSRTSSPFPKLSQASTTNRSRRHLQSQSTQ